ncbi:hypothetical protein LTR94_031272, partial [Friedmanniomyces endolithicus]
RMRIGPRIAGGSRMTPGTFLDPAALAIVGGGTVLATLLRTPLADVACALSALRLLLRRRFATILFVVSLLAVVLQFGWVFAATDLIAAKGAATVVPFPLAILAVALLQVTVARHADARGWLS